jgi:hypothetical protein
VPLRLILPALVATAAVAGGCGHNEGLRAGASVDLTITRADGTAVASPNPLHAWCGPFDEDNADTEAVHVMAGKLDPHSSFWQMDAVRADVERDPVTTLPNSFVFTEPRRASLFAYDNKPRGNELSSAEEESSGTIRVDLAGCDVGGTVRLKFDHVVLGSELHDLGSLSFNGEVTAVISDE